MKNKILLILSFLLFSFVIESRAESGYELWLRYHLVENVAMRTAISKQLRHICIQHEVSSLKEAAEEICLAAKGLAGVTPVLGNDPAKATVWIASAATDKRVEETVLAKDVSSLGDEGYIIRSFSYKGKNMIAVFSKTNIGALYGTFHFIRLLQQGATSKTLAIREVPQLKYRMFNHWDNLNGTIERGYAGFTLWNWQRLPMYIDQRIIDYARANASVGINGVVLNNVNANARSLTQEYLVKAAALANAFRPYGIKVYLTARFSAPIEIGRLKTADPLNDSVREWWKEKAKEIYFIIPDFGGFLVKANSEGQPGPQDYKRTHADGANMMAAALEPFGGIVMWRAFVYENNRHVDRAKNGYEEFAKFNGIFAKNVFLQPKNGAVDFQPREPFHPLLGKMDKTPLMLEFQITQEYLGYATNLVYLAPLFKETLDSDTYTRGKGTTVADVITGYNKTHQMSGMAGVPNIGTDVNWTGHLFGQSNWFAYGQLAWNPARTSEKIAREWIDLTFGKDREIESVILPMMLSSRETQVKFRGPLGLNHIMNFATHYGPGPWYKDNHWDARDYHKADSIGLGVDRTAHGSNVAGQYAPEVGAIFGDPEKCPEQFLLYFNHVEWDRKLKSGRTMWNELVHLFYEGVKEVSEMRRQWETLEGKVDHERFDHVRQLLKAQEDESIWWRDGCVLYFQTFSKRPIPADYPQPQHSLNYYKRIPFPFDWKNTYK